MSLTKRFVVMAMAVLAFYSPTDASDMLDALRDAQKANIGRYPSGEMHVIFRQGEIGAVTSHGYADCRVQWSGRKVRTTVERWRLKNRGEVPTTPSSFQEQWLVDETRAACFTPHSQRVTVDPLSTHEPPVYALLAPETSWYGAWGGRGANWLDYLTPELMINVDHSQVTYQVKPINEDQTEVMIRNPVYNLSAKLTMSLRTDGNVIANEAIAPGGNSPEKAGICHWKQDGKGRWYVASRKEDLTFRTSGNAVMYYELETVEFSPDRKIDPSRFTIESFGVRDGGTIRDGVEGQLFRVGDRSVESVANQLDGLAKTLRVRGFAAENRP